MAIQAPDPHENDWILGLLHKHVADSICILGELIDAGIRNGTCSVNDVRTIPKDKGVTGAVMKLLKQIGFVHTAELIPDTRPGKKGKVSLWKIAERNKVDAYLEYQLQYFHAVLNVPLGSS